jgi:hypothetical protein
MSSPLKYALIFALILVGIIAFSACAVCPFDACMQAFCGAAHDSRPLGRLASGLTAAFLSVALTVGLFAMGSLRFDSVVADFMRLPVRLRASALRI